MSTNFCENVFNVDKISYEGTWGVGALQLVVSAVYFVETLILILLIRRQHRLAYRGESESSNLVIFPQFVTVLWVNACINIYIAITFIFVPIPINGTYTHSNAVLFALLNSLQHFVTEGVLFLLMEKGMGARSAYQCLLKAISWGIFVFIIRYLNYTVEHHYTQFFTYLVWLSAVALVYLAVWITPKHMLFRRPAAIRYAMFWFFYQLLCICDFVLQSNSLTVPEGNCLYAFGSVFGFALAEPIVVYLTLRRDCMWWQGLAIAGVDNSRMSMSLKKTEGRHSECMGLDPETGVVSTRISEADATIASPLAGMDLTQNSAQQLAASLDHISSPGGVKLLNFAYVKLNTKKLLGQGSFSKVYRGHYRGMACAVKLIYTVDLTLDTIERVAAEAEILSCLKHINIVAIYGIAVLPPSVCILLELCKYGSLGDVIRGRESFLVHGKVPSTPNGKISVSIADKLYLALGCARGIAALHQYKEGICHRDIKSFNFLVDGQLNAKIADLELGVNRKKDGSVDDGFYRSNGVGVGTLGYCIGSALGIDCCKNEENSRPTMSSAYGMSIRSSGIVVEKFDTFLANWAAPEFVSTGIYTQSSDIYSLGLVLWEIFSEQVPYAEVATQELVRKHVLDKKLPPMPSNIPALYKDLVFSMLSYEKFLRPDAESVVRTLEQLWTRHCYDACIVYSDSIHSNEDRRSSQGRDTNNSTLSAHSANSSNSELDKNDVCRPIACITVPKIGSIENEIFTRVRKKEEKHDMAWSVVAPEFPHFLLKENSRWRFLMEGTATSAKQSSVVTLLSSENSTAEEVALCEKFMKALTKPEPNHFMLKFDNGKLYSVHCLPIRVKKAERNRGNSNTVCSTDAVSGANNGVSELSSSKNATTANKITGFVRHASMALGRRNSSSVMTDHVMCLGINEITDVIPTTTTSNSGAGDMKCEDPAETISPLFAQKEVVADVEMAGKK